MDLVFVVVRGIGTAGVGRYVLGSSLLLVVISVATVSGCIGGDLGHQGFRDKGRSVERP